MHDAAVNLQSDSVKSNIQHSSDSFLGGRLAWLLGIMPKLSFKLLLAWDKIDVLGGNNFT